MAVAAEVLLLAALVSHNIQADVIQAPGGWHDFLLDEAADFCSVSRWTGGEKTLLWNSSVSQDSRLQRRQSYRISRLNVPDSGQYQEQCWTQGNVSLERNSTLLVCDGQMMQGFYLALDVGQTAELTCVGAGPNQSFQWAFQYDNNEPETTALTLVDSERPSLYQHQLVKNQSSLLLTVDKHSYDISYFCLGKNQHRCDIHNHFRVEVALKFILHSVGDTLELNCSDGRNQPSVLWVPPGEGIMIDNSTLTIPALTLNHTGRYICGHDDLYQEYYDVIVCPESDPPAVVLFTGGENVTLQCGAWKRADEYNWFLRSNRTGGRVSVIRYYQQQNKMYVSDGTLVITNVSVEDSAEFWCVMRKDTHCVFILKTLVMFDEPEVDHHLVRSVLLSVVITITCVVVVATVRRSRGRLQVPAPVEELEMSELSPESGDQQLETAV